jgi:Spy/CpxP family protein refolding chaperone
MKAVVTALALAVLIGASAFVVQLAPAYDHGPVAGQRHGGQHQGYPLTDWYQTETVW